MKALIGGELDNVASVDDQLKLIHDEGDAGVPRQRWHVSMSQHGTPEY